MLIEVDQLLVVRRHECGNGANALPAWLTIVARTEKPLISSAHQLDRLWHFYRKQIRIRELILLQPFRYRIVGENAVVTGCMWHDDDSAILVLGGA
jgi:hypothetical protein